MRQKIQINGEAYWLSPLRCGMLREISECLLTGELTGDDVCTTIENWMPFILESLKVKHPNICIATVQELTLEEVNSAITTVIAISGIKLNSQKIDEDGQDKDNSSDWGDLYARLCCNTYLTYRDIDEMFLSEVEEVLNYLAVNPTAAEILKAVHKVETKRRYKRPSEQEFERQFSEGVYNKDGLASTGCVQNLEALPKEMRDNLSWASDLEAKFRKARNIH